jgi:peptidoglycan/LPS O-acetylase OafA/YrhL
MSLRVYRLEIDGLRTVAALPAPLFYAEAAEERCYPLFPLLPLALRRRSPARRATAALIAFAGPRNLTGWVLSPALAWMTWRFVGRPLQVSPARGGGSTAPPAGPCRSAPRRT